VKALYLAPILCGRGREDPFQEQGLADAKAFLSQSRSSQLRDWSRMSASRSVCDARRRNERRSMLNNVQAKQLRQLPVVRDEKDKDPPKTRAKTDRWTKSDGWTPIAHVESYQPPPFWPYFSPQRAGPAFVIADDEGYAVWTSSGPLIAPLSVSLSFLRYACCFSFRSRRRPTRDN